MFFIKLTKLRYPTVILKTLKDPIDNWKYINCTKSFNNANYINNYYSVWENIMQDNISIILDEYKIRH